MVGRVKSHAYTSHPPSKEKNMKKKMKKKEKRVEENGKRVEGYGKSVEKWGKGEKLARMISKYAPLH